MELTRCPVPTPTRAPDGETNTYVVGRAPALLVDPAGRTEELDRLVRDRRVAHILVTHTHPDHVGAVDEYARETGATVWARAGHRDRFRAATGIEPDRTMTGGTTISLSRGEGHTGEFVHVLDTPGHTPDHVSIVVGDGGPICCGDCAVRDGSVVVGAPDGDVRAYLTSLRRLLAIGPPKLLPGHGPPIDDPRHTLERIVSHRLERERRILDAVEDGARRLEEILERAYEKDLTGVEDLARATVVAHLEKLAVEGKLEWDGERARSSRT